MNRDDNAYRPVAYGGSTSITERTNVRPPTGPTRRPLSESQPNDVVAHRAHGESSNSRRDPWPPVLLRRRTGGMGIASPRQAAARHRRRATHDLKRSERGPLKPRRTDRESGWSVASPSALNARTPGPSSADEEYGQ